MKKPLIKHFILMLGAVVAWSATPTAQAHEEDGWRDRSALHHAYEQRDHPLRWLEHEHQYGAYRARVALRYDDARIRHEWRKRHFREREDHREWRDGPWHAHRW
jgi:hypothetical protein